MSTASGAAPNRPSLALRSSLALLLLVPALPLDALEVQSFWGFDGRVLPGYFVPITVVVTNTDAEPFRGPVRLVQGFGLGTGVPHVTAVDLAPGASARLRFVPFVRRSNETWSLRWGLAGSERLTVPELGGPARVFLHGDGERPPQGIAGLAEAEFPRTVAATGILGEVVLDHVPELSAAQAEALRDWLRGGGVVHLLSDDFGDHPRFPAELRELNRAGTEVTVGAGRLVRHAATRRALPASLRARAEPEVTDADPQAVITYEDREDRIARTLGVLHEPDHSWPLIAFLAVVFALLAGPGGWLVSRQRTGILVPLLFLFAVVVVFGAFFYMSGRRGFGEEQVIRTVAYARELGDGDYDVQEWCDVFVTTGGPRIISHDRAESLYDTVLDTEAVSGVVPAEPPRSLTVDMPAYSWREFVHHGKHVGAPLVEEVVELRLDGSHLVALELRLGRGYPDDGIHVQWAVFGDTVHELRRDGRRLVLAGAKKSRASVIRDDRVEWPNARSFGGAQVDRAILERRVHDALRALVLNDVFEKQRRRQAPEAVHLIVHADRPAAFLPLAGDWRQRGTVIYHRLLTQQ